MGDLQTNIESSHTNDLPHQDVPHRGSLSIGAERAGNAVKEDVRRLREDVERLRKHVEDDDTVAIVRKMFTRGGAGDKQQEEQKKRLGIGDKIAGACDAMWGGPVAPRENDTIISWFSNFCGGVTTAHGINRVFDEGQGPVRRIFWILFFLASFIVLWFLVNSAIVQYMQADVATSIYTEDGSSIMPMVTVCNSSPLRCGCEVQTSACSCVLGYFVICYVLTSYLAASKKNQPLLIMNNWCAGILRPCDD